MKNTEYKCLCCGWLGNEEMLGIDATNIKVTDDVLDICPQCGSMDIHEVFDLEKHANKGVVSPI